MNKTHSFVEHAVLQFKFLSKSIKPYKSIELMCFVGGRPVPNVVLFTAFGEDGVEILCQDGTKSETRVYTTLEQLSCEIIIYDNTPEEPDKPRKEIGFKQIWENDLKIQ